MSNKIQFKRGIKATLPVLSVGEPALCTDTGEVFIGGTSGNIGIAKASDLTEMSRLARARDARSEGFKTPQWYIDNGFKNQNLLELNIQSNVGLSGGIMCHVLSIIPWHDTSGAITQLITVVDGNTYKRWSTSGATWSPTVRILDEHDTRIIQYVGDNYDLNNAVQSSIVGSASFLNFPVGLVGDAQGVCEITRYALGWVKQVFITPHADYTCERISSNGIWLPWHVNFNSGNYGFYSYTADQTLSLANANRILGTSSNVIVPNHSSVQIPLNTQITVINWSGTTTFLPSGGVFIYSKDNKRTIDGNYASATLIKVESNSWYLIGALK